VSSQGQNRVISAPTRPLPTMAACPVPELCGSVIRLPHASRPTPRPSRFLTASRPLNRFVFRARWRRKSSLGEFRRLPPPGRVRDLGGPACPQSEAPPGPVWSSLPPRPDRDLAGPPGCNSASGGCGSDRTVWAGTSEVGACR
jgi:hypothetical protein